MSKTQPENTPPEVPPAGTQGAAPADQGPALDAAAPAGPASELDALRRQVAELQDQNLRLIAEARNQQQRALREKAEALRYAEAEFARELLVVADDLARTTESVRDGADVTAMAEGVRIIADHFLKVLKSRGIEPIEAVGVPFDPHVHEALMQQPSAEFPAGTVSQEVARGYRMHERVLRPARVVVSSGPARPDAQPPRPASEQR